MRYVAAVASAAAVITLFFYVMSDPSQNATVAETTIVEEIDYDDYLAYMDEEDIIDYIVENDIEVESEEVEVDEEDLFDFYGSDFDLLMDEL